jgi:hypothetical protein
MQRQRQFLIGIQEACFLPRVGDSVLDNEETRIPLNLEVGVV